MKQIELTRGAVAQVDDADYEGLAWRKWQCSAQGYATTNIPTGKYAHKTVYMHRMIMDAPPGMEVDHIDGNKLNNQRDNLRLCTRRQNARNQHKRENAQSKYKGVYVRPTRKSAPYSAHIHWADKCVYLGSFAVEEQAAYAYDVAAVKYYGEYAQTNGVPPVDLDAIRSGGRFNTSGIANVQLQRGQYKGYIVRDGKRLYTALYRTPEEAETARQEYERTGIKPYKKRNKQNE